VKQGSTLAYQDKNCDLSEPTSSQAFISGVCSQMSEEQADNVNEFLLCKLQ
jgi:hypothetical protein